MLKNRTKLWWAAVIIGWSFDLLYWGKPMGISFAIQILLFLAGLWFLSRQENKHLARTNLSLIGLILTFGVLTFLREEPFTRTLNHLMSLLFLGLLLLSFQGGRWAAYNLADYVMGSFRLLIHMIALPVDLISDQRSNSAEDQENDPGGRTDPGWKKTIPFLRGILLALPIVAILASLLSAADPIFSEWFSNLIELLNLENLPEYILRLFLIGMWTFISAGLLLYALLKSDEESLIGLEKPWPPRFLGFTETSIILGSINLLFLAFVTIQFRYFFGGEKNISLEGFTYAEYARRGFGELLAVAFFTLLFLMILNTIALRSSRRHQIVFSVLSSALTVFIWVILLSSHQRLALYESAYGFTRLRTYSHLCILWVGILFAAVLALEILGKPRYFSIAAVGAVAGFVLTMNAINVDQLIVRRNLERAATMENALDVHYLKTLSNDAIPAMVTRAEAPGLTDREREEIAAVLACRAFELEDQSWPWQSFLWPRYRANKALKENPSLWEDVQLEKQYSSWYVEIGSEKFFCGYYRDWD